ncbi:hypothetical protein HID58_089761, partial [Brassica napus]
CGSNNNRAQLNINASSYDGHSTGRNSYQREHAASHSNFIKQMAYDQDLRCYHTSVPNWFPILCRLKRNYYILSNRQLQLYKMGFIKFHFFYKIQLETFN